MVLRNGSSGVVPKSRTKTSCFYALNSLPEDLRASVNIFKHKLNTSLPWLCCPFCTHLRTFWTGTTLVYTVYKLATDFGDPLSLLLVPPWGWHFWHDFEWNGLLRNLVQTFMFPTGWIVMTMEILWHLVPSFYFLFYSLIWQGWYVEAVLHWNIMQPMQCPQDFKSRGLQGYSITSKSQFVQN